MAVDMNFSNGGETVHSTDWSQTPLGPIENWPRSLKTAVSMMVPAKAKICIFWGNDLLLIYNDAYCSLIGEKHPQALGQPAREVFREAWETLEPRFAAVMSGQGAVEEHAQFVPMDTGGGIEDKWWDYTLNPIPCEDGSIGGVFNIVVEATSRVRTEKALRKSESRYRSLFENMTEGFALGEAICEGEATPCNLKLIEINQAFEQQSGLTRDILDKPITEVLPHLEKQWFDNCCFVAHTGESLRFEQYNRDTDRYYDVFCYSPAKGRFAAILRNITEQKRVEEMLRESEKTLNAVLDTLPVGVVIADARGRIVRFTEPARELWGVPPETESWEEYQDWVGWWPETGERIKAEEWAMARALLHGEETRDELVQNQRFGTDERRFYLNNVAPLRDAEGRIIGGVAAMLDVTDRLAAEKALRESEVRFRSLVQASSEVLYSMSPDWSEIRQLHSRGFLSDIKMPGRTWLHEYILPEDQPYVWSAIEKAIRTKSIFELEHRVLRADGTVGWTFSRAVPLLDDKGEISEWFGAASDITERKRAEDALRKALADAEEGRRTLEAMMEHIPMGITIADAPDVRIRAVSRFGRELIGKPLEQIESIPMDLRAERWGIYRDDGVTQAKNEELPLTRATREGELVMEEEWVLGHPDGTRIPILCTAAPIRDKEGHITGGVSGWQDISSHKRAEEELQRAQRLESIGLLAGGIAHDFNNILTAILGNITLARMFLPPGERAVEKLKVAEQASIRARGLANQLLTFAKGGAPVKKILSVPGLVNEAVGLVLRGSQVKAESSFPPDLRPVEADEGQLHQAINNIAINAAQAMPEGGVLNTTGLNVSLPQGNKQGLAAGEYIRIDISDQGRGVPKEVIEKIFDPYFTTKELGSGLGLSISYSIVKRHGGTITVNSSSGKGSIFSIFLPAAKNKGETPRKEMHEKIEPGMGRILVMDDEELVREIAAELLRHLGYQAETVKDGAEAITAYRQARSAGDPFDVVITDLTVPGGMGGKEAVQKLLEIDQQAKVIVASGYAHDPVISDYAAYGFKGVIPKPFRIDDLSKTLKEVLGDKE
jgi:PAS domain S-box-containing protein